MKREFIKKIKIPNHFLIAASSWGAKLVVALVQVASIHYLLDMMGENGYAAFVLLSGLLVWGGIADFGIGSSLQNYISESRAKNEDYKKYIKASFNIVILGMFFLFFILYISSGFLSELYLASFSEMEIGSKSDLFFSASVLFCSIGVGTVMCKIWFAEQAGWKANTVNALAYLLGFLGIWFSHKMEINLSIKLSLIAMFFPLSLFTLFFLFKKFWISISENITAKNYIDLAKRGRGFFFFSILSVLVLQADYIVMSQKLSTADIITYSVLMKIFSLAFFIYSAVLQALWPVCTELCVNKKWRELNKIVILNIVIGSLVIIMFTAIIFFLKDEIIPLISNKIDLSINYSIFLMFGVYFIIRVWCDSFAMLLQSMNYLKPLLYLVPIQVVVGFSSQWFFAEEYGIVGMLSGLSLSFIATVFWGLPYYYCKLIKEK
ncbi:MATE family efflux transporter [Pectobacterium versatile]|uniref:MATE family efflux transporter n=1 Tax=Pectobacterium versatile TaxID=2488639 RepID=UPI00301A1E7B